jgi:Suppressor of fused protein (SUFU)
MGASPIIKQVYREHMEHFGEPDDSVVYEDHDAPDGRPARIDIFVWRATAEIDITTFATIGMAAAPMSGADHRAELHFSIRCPVDSTTIGKTSKFLANLAIHPFLNATFFDWWHKIGVPGPIPLFTSATAVLFHPKFVEAGWDRMELDGALVKILNVVPITPDEHRIASVSDLIAHWAKIDIDLFAPR